MTTNKHDCLARVIWQSKGHRLALTLALLWALWTAHPAWAGDPVPHIDSIQPSGWASPGQPFEVEVWASNIGSDAEGGGSITLSLPDGGDVTIFDAGPGVHILSGNSTSDCKDANTHALVVKPGATCNTALRHNTACKSTIEVSYPLAEAWYNPWGGGEQHYLRVRVSPHAGASRVTVFIRVAMRATKPPSCDLRLVPDETNAQSVDQQGFPVRDLTVVVNTPTPTWAPVPRPTTVTPRPPTVSPILPTSTLLPTLTPILPTTRVSSTVVSRYTPTLTATVTPVSPPTGNIGLVLGVLSVLAVIILGGGTLLLSQKQSAASGSAMGQSQPLVPVIGGRYRILNRLGQGGMGSVYLAEDTRLPGRRCAVKEMSPANVPQQDLAWAIPAFQQEAQILARLSHPSLTAVTDFFSEGNNWYLVMDYVEGETLEDRLQRTSGRRLPLQETLNIMRQLCDVFEYLHDQIPPVIFRDLKPGNVMLTPQGQVKLIDFGIARFFKPGQTRDTVRLGTPGYAAPEQGGHGQTDVRSDIYSLGVLLHELLTGYDPTATPFVLPKLRQLNPAISARTEAAIERATQADPARRFQTVIEMKQALGIN